MPTTRLFRLFVAATLAGAAIAVLAAGAALVCPASACGAVAVDAAGLGALRAWSDRRLDPAFGALTWLGSLVVLLPAAALLAWRLRRHGRGRTAAFVPVALLGAAAIAHGAKLAVARPRPDLFPALVAVPADASFPSAHAMQATAFVLAWLLQPGTRPQLAAALLACTLAFAVGASRVYLQVHFPTDVAFGIAAATLWVLALRCAPVWQGGAR